MNENVYRALENNKFYKVNGLVLNPFVLDQKLNITGDINFDMGQKLTNLLADGYINECKKVNQQIKDCLAGTKNLTYCEYVQKQIKLW